MPAGFAVDAATHDAWFRAKVQQVLDDPRSAVPHEKSKRISASSVQMLGLNWVKVADEAGVVASGDG